MIKKRTLRAYQTVNFFDSWHMDRLYLSLAVQKKITKFYTYINVVRVKSETCKFLRNSCTDFLVPYDVEVASPISLEVS